jgi:hypothetical protein
MRSKSLEAGQLQRGPAQNEGWQGKDAAAPAGSL